MNAVIRPAMLWALLVVAAAGRPAAAAEWASLDATDIVRRSDDLQRREESYARFDMVIVRPDWTRTLAMEGWTQGARNSFMRVLAPKKERGVTFLKKDREAWQYIPSIDRVIKIPPSMMLQSWMGSDFTNDDVVRADSLVVDYEHEIVDAMEREGIGYWIIEGIPKPNAPVVWGKVVFTIRRNNLVADRVEFFDEDGQLMKYYQTHDIETIEGLDVATQFTMYDLTRPGHHTTLTYQELTFDVDLDPRMFSVAHLRR